MTIFSNRLLQFLCLQVTSAFSRSFFFEPFRKQLWKKHAFHWHLFMGCCHFFKLSVIRLSRMGGRLQWNIFSWDEVGRHSGENHYYHWGSESKVIWNISKTFGIKGCPPDLIGLFSRHFYPFFVLFFPRKQVYLCQFIRLFHVWSSVSLQSLV